MIKILLILSQEFILTITYYQFKTDKHRPNFFYAGLILELHLLHNSKAKIVTLTDKLRKFHFLERTTKKTF